MRIRLFFLFHGFNTFLGVGERGRVHYLLKIFTSYQGHEPDYKFRLLHALHSVISMQPAAVSVYLVVMACHVVAPFLSIPPHLWCEDGVLLGHFAEVESTAVGEGASARRRSWLSYGVSYVVIESTMSV